MSARTTIVNEWNRILAHKGVATPGTSTCECVKKLAKVTDDVDIPDTILTVAGALQWWAGVLTEKCKTTFIVKSKDDGTAIASPTITVKSGTTIGSGTAVTPVSGVYSLTEGGFNYSVAKTGYVTKTGTITITEELIIGGVLVINVELETDD